MLKSIAQTHGRAGQRRAAEQTMRRAAVQLDAERGPYRPSHLQLAWNFAHIPVHSPIAAARGALQRQLVVGADNDPLEVEADRIAAQVVSAAPRDPSVVSTSGTMQRAPGDRAEASASGTQPSARLVDNAPARTAAPPIVDEVLRQSGRPLEPQDQAFFETRFGWDFSGIRIHADERAAASAASVQARAFAVGRDVVFGAGRYAPRTAAGRRLMAHELTHVVQQGHASAPAGNGASLRQLSRHPEIPRVSAAAGSNALQRAPLYDKTVLTFTPPARGTTEPFMRAQLDAKTQGAAPDITSYTIKGAKPTEDAYIFLEALIYEFGKRDRWNTVARLVMDIGWENPVSSGAGIIPEGLCSLEIDASGNATAELISRVNTAVSPAVKDAVGTLKTTYGFADVLSGDKAPAGAQNTPPDPSAAWSQSDLEAVVQAVGLLPAGDQAALKGVLLLRYKTLPDAAGQFNRGAHSAAGTTITTIKPAYLKLADSAFSTGRFEVGPPGGTPLSGAIQLIVHEIGHAVEAEAYREKEQQADQAVVAQNKAVADYKAVSAAAPGTQKQKDAYAKYRSAKSAADTAKAAFQGTVVGSKVTAPVEADVAAKKKAYDAAYGAAKSAASGWAANEIADSAAYRAAVDAVAKLVADYVLKAQPGGGVDTLDAALLAAVEQRKQARADLAKAGTNPALAAFAPVDSAQDDWVDAARMLGHTRGRTRRLQKFVDLIKGPPPIEPPTAYARANLPFKPEEFYAEAYSLWITEPDFLKKNYPTLFNFFASGDYEK